MIQGLMMSIVALLDLAALTTMLGTAWFILWMRSLSGAETGYPPIFPARLRLLLMICLTTLVISSIGGLIERSMEMSGLGITSVMPVLQTVLFKSHYGSTWFVRLVGLAAAWAVFLTGKQRVSSRVFGALLLVSGAVIAFSRSASGHSADFGDLSIQQFADWFHLLSVAFWAGTLIALAVILPVSPATEDTLLRRFIAGIADRFYVLFGPLLSIIVLTGLYNAWVEVGSFPALVSTPYGRLLSAKLALLLLLTFRYLAPPEHGQDEALYAIRFIRRTRVEAVIVLGILLFVSLLVHQIPARHQAHLGSAQGDHAGHGAHMYHTPQGPEPVVILEIKPEEVKAGRPVDMTVRMKDQNGRPIEGLEVSHERILHAIIISRDLNIFAHIHAEDLGPVTAEMVKSATLPLQFSFPMAGEYLIGIDFAAAGNLYSKAFPVKVDGSPRMGEPKTDFSTKKRFGDYTVSLTLSPEEIVAGKEATLKYIIERNGKAVTDLEPYLGASMHVATVPTSLKLFIHAHGMTPDEPHSPLGHMHATPPLQFGPEIDVDIVFPVKGAYKVYSQVKHKGKVLLFDFMVDVQ